MARSKEDTGYLSEAINRVRDLFIKRNDDLIQVAAFTRIAASQAGGATTHKVYELAVARGDSNQDRRTTCPCHIKRDSSSGYAMSRTKTYARDLIRSASRFVPLMFPLTVDSVAGQSGLLSRYSTGEDLHYMAGRRRECPRLAQT